MCLFYGFIISLNLSFVFSPLCGIFGRGTFMLWFYMWSYQSPIFISVCIYLGSHILIAHLFLVKESIMFCFKHIIYKRSSFKWFVIPWPFRVDKPCIPSKVKVAFNYILLDWYVVLGCDAREKAWTHVYTSK